VVAELWFGGALIDSVLGLATVAGEEFWFGVETESVLALAAGAGVEVL
jgi:hypothetical protein